jgi:hypothetical protein
MTFDVWWNVLVVRMGAGERQLVRMRLGVVPVQSFFGSRYPIAISLDCIPSKVQIFPNAQGDVPLKLKVTVHFRERRAMPNNDQSRVLNGGYFALSP